MFHITTNVLITPTPTGAKGSAIVGATRSLVDGEGTRVCAQAPGYPLQLILGVFDFPDRRPAGNLTVPELVVHRVHGTG